ncbi:four helix bundle protein [Clostridium guangxiense]|uniref:four helix bundle protein n=1 Tax=Clostridium guangxiense TaxID=1662055 RepID=UPI001E48C102|nr:four helix bundle protein [Clostridium guangxiense]MCD2346268.1 four helix bundle protein [Clostridium guangxiense]
MSVSIIREKSFNFAVDIIKFYKKMISENKDMVLSQQILRSGTSIGANVKEGISAQSKRDFLTKMNIALKEAEETEYWIELFMAAGYIKERQPEILNKCKELCRMLSSTVSTTKQHLNIE